MKNIEILIEMEMVDSYIAEFNNPTFTQLVKSTIKVISSHTKLTLFNK